MILILRTILIYKKRFPAPEWKSEVSKRSACAPEWKSETSAKSICSAARYPQVIHRSLRGYPAPHPSIIAGFFALVKRKIKNNLPRHLSPFMLVSTYYHAKTIKNPLSRVLLLGHLFHQSFDCFSVRSFETV